MRFGYFTPLFNPEWVRSYPQLIVDVREEAVLADELGYDTFWLGEHHFGAEGMDTLPNPILLAADLACRTSRIRLGMLAVVINFWHPLRLAEDVALLDLMTQGRIELGLARGFLPREAVNLQPKADPGNEAVSRALFAETLETMKKAWAEPYFSHQGPNYTFPLPGTKWDRPLYEPDPDAVRDGEIAKLFLVPKPYQNPHPPLWMMIATESSFKVAAQLGLKGVVWIQTPRRLRERLQLYAEIRSATEGRPFKVGEDIAWLRNVYVAPTMEEARRDAERGMVHCFRWLAGYRPPSFFAELGEELPPDMQLDWDFLSKRMLLVGPPEHVAERLSEMREITGIDHFIGITDVGWIPHKKVMRSMELFATKVVPLLEAKEAKAIPASD